MPNSFDCSAEEWEFSRYHTFFQKRFEGYEDVEQLSSRGIKRVVLIVVTMFAIGMLGGLTLPAPFDFWFGILASASIPAFMLLFRRLKRKISRLENSIIHHPAVGERIEFVTVTPEQLRINIRNDANRPVIIRWDIITGMRFSYTQDPSKFKNVYYSSTIKNREFMKIKSGLPTFNEKVEPKYKDRFALVLFYERIYAVQVPIPTSWLASGQFHLFANKCEEMTGKKVQPDSSELTPILTQARNQNYV